MYNNQSTGLTQTERQQYMHRDGPDHECTSEHRVENNAFWNVP